MRIPNGWQNKRFVDLCDKIMDGTHFSPKMATEGRLYVTSRNIRPFTLDLSEPLFISEDDHRSIYQRCDVRCRDVMLTKDGANTGNAVVNPLVDEFSLLSSVAVLRPDREQLLEDYLCQFLNSPWGRHQSTAAMDGLAIRRLTLEKIRDLPMVVPSLLEQRTIVAILNTWDRAIKQTTRLIEAKRRLKQGLMQQLLTGKRRLSGFFATSWGTVRLGDVFVERVEDEPW